MSFKNRNFVWIFLAGFVSALGDTFYFLTLSWLVVDRFHSGTLMGTIMLIVGTIRFLFGMLGGGIVDLIGPKRVLILSNVFRAGVMAAMFAALTIGEVEVWYLLVLGVLFGFVDSLYWPASSALQQRVLLTFGELNQANSMLYTISRLLTLFGPALGAYLLLVASYSTIMLVIGAAFLGSALLISFITVREDQPEPTPRPQSKSADNPLKTLRSNLREGYGFLLTNRVLLTMVLTIFFANIGANGVMVLFPFLVNDLGWGGNGLGILQVSTAAGSILCGFVFSVRPFKTASIYIPMIGFFGQGAMLVVIALQHHLGGVSASLFVQGMFTALIGVMIPTIVQTLVPKHMMGQVGGIMMTISMASTPFSQFLFGTLTDSFGSQSMFWIAGCLEVATAMAAILFLKKLRIPYSLQVSSEGVSQ
ncbi:MFS transporter [Tumebacillus sp. ITR2]|uniref:MFS transporter n=1 Tax=Tumebacillus amylolyticus TaxID=2801339 RepID=A0ABS1J6N6_9BACL|nr:MFS transporter [Tumebacillus amylolyticus]